MKVKQLLAVLLSVTMICGLIPAVSFGASAAEAVLTTSYKKSTTPQMTINRANCFRYADWLVRYDYGFDAKTDYELNNSPAPTGGYSNLNHYTEANYTATNSYGIEVLVNEFNLVTEIIDGKGNAPIPKNGYVLSAHGTKATTLREMVASGELKVGTFLRSNDLNTFAFLTTNEDSQYTHPFDWLKIPRVTSATDDKDVVITNGGTGKKTGSSEWCNDVLIKSTGTGADGVAGHEGYVVRFGGNNIDVPAGYFALSLPGQTLKDNAVPSLNASYAFDNYAKPGALVSVNSDSILFRYDSASVLRGAYLLTGLVNSSIGVDKVYDYSASAILNDAKTKYELVDTDAMQALYDNMAAVTYALDATDLPETATGASRDAIQVYHATINQHYIQLLGLEFEKRPVEMRAIWWRPFENEFHKDGYVPPTAAELDAHLEKNIRRFKELGYNQLFVEGFYNSCTIFPVPASAGHKGLYFSQHPYLVPTNVKCGSSGLYGQNYNLTEPYDMLKRTIEICDEYDIECHLWWEVLYIGYERHNTSNSDDLVEYGIGYTIEKDIKSKGDASKYYNWLNVAQDGSLRSGTNTTLTRLWLNPGNDDARQLLLNILDYVCATYDVYSFQLDYFRHPNDGVHEFGYDSDTVAAFKAKYTAYKNTDLTQKTYWKNADWLQFRADYITSLIGEMRAMLDEKYPLVGLTTSPDPAPESALRNCLQDVNAWLGNGYIDTIYPMAYGQNVPAMVAPVLVAKNPDHFVCIGTSAAYNSDAYEQHWLKVVRAAGADGIAAFEEIDSWANYAWSEPAVTPTGNATRAAKVYLSETMTARAAKMRELAAITAAQHTALMQRINAALEAVTKYSVNSVEAIAALNALNTFAATLSTNPKKAIENDVAYVTKIRKNARVFEIQEGQTAVSGVIEDTIPMSLDGVDYVEFNNVTLTSANSYAWYSKEKKPTVKIELTGKNIFNHGSKDFMNFDASNLTYCGTGAIYHDGELFLMMGNVSGDEALDSEDIRDLLRANVKLQTLTSDQKAISDANGDGRIDTIDTRIFLDTVVG